MATTTSRVALACAVGAFVGMLLAAAWLNTPSQTGRSGSVRLFWSSLGRPLVQGHAWVRHVTVQPAVGDLERVDYELLSRTSEPGVLRYVPWSVVIDARLAADGTPLPDPWPVAQRILSVGGLAATEARYAWWNDPVLVYASGALSGSLVLGLVAAVLPAEVLCRPVIDWTRLLRLTRRFKPVRIERRPQSPHDVIPEPLTLAAASPADASLPHFESSPRDDAEVGASGGVGLGVPIEFEGEYYPVVRERRSKVAPS